MLKVTILGCGSSCGVPVIGCKCSVCKSDSPYNKRRSASILIESKAARILVDFGFDIKNQLIDAKVDFLDAAILTHDHADHVSGVDHLRIFKWLTGDALKIVTDAGSANKLRERYDYLISNEQLMIEEVGCYSPYKIKDTELQFFWQEHSDIGSLGVRINDFVYSCDVSDFPEGSHKFLENIDCWVLDCCGFRSSFAHAGLDKVLEWNELFKPKRIYLTSMRDEIDYFEIQKYLPDNIKPCYDGMVLEL